VILSLQQIVYSCRALPVLHPEGQTVSCMHRESIWGQAADCKQIMEHTYCNIEDHACCNSALIARLKQVDGFSELKSHAKANVFGQMLNKMSLLGILHT